MTNQIIHFNEGDVEVIEFTNGKWQAIKVENCGPDSPIGRGSTMMEAIADLQEKIDGLE